MKFKYFFLFLALAAVVGCDNSFDTEEEFDLEILPGYVAFDAPGTDAVMDDVTVDEAAGTTSFFIENPTGTLTDIDVSYTLGGSAVFGEDYTIEGATAAGGSILLEADPSDFQFNDRVELVINILTDEVVDGEKTLMITLESASNGEGALAVGRGGTDFLKTATVIITDVDE